MNQRSKHFKYIISDNDNIIIIQKYGFNQKPKIAFRNIYGKIYWYEKDRIIFLKENKEDNYKIAYVDEKLIYKVDLLCKEMTNLMKKPIDLNNQIDVLLELK